MRRAASLALLLLAASRHSAASAPSDGARLYTGEAPLSGVIAGHGTPMPPAVLACANCHAGSPSQVGGDGRAAPDLRGGWLTQIMSRRNGPAGRYTRAGFCRLLRTGIDPLDIVLAVQMPRFIVSDEECAELWAYLNPPS